MDYNLEQGGPVLNPDAPPAAPDAKAPYVDNGADIKAPSRYYTAAWKAKEWERVWSRVWTIAGLVSDIPEVGDFLTYDLLHESFVIVRTGAGPAGPGTISAATAATGWSTPISATSPAASPATSIPGSGTSTAGWPMSPTRNPSGPRCWPARPTWCPLPWTSSPG